MSAANVTRLRRVYEHWSHGDFRSDKALFGEDFEWRQGPEAVEPGTHRGAEGAAKMARGVFEVFENFRIVPEEFIDIGDRVLAVSRIHGTLRGGGLELDRPYLLVWTFRDSEPISVAAYRDRAEALQALGHPPDADLQ